MLAKRFLVTLTLFGLYLSASPSANAELAQASPPATPRATPPPTKPATDDEITTYMAMAAINMCTLSELKQPFKESLSANAQMVGSVLAQRHGFLVTGNPNKLTPEQLLNGAVVQIVPRVEAICGKSLSPAWRKDVDSILSDIRKQAGGGSGTK
ncbi:hypothetical protein [Cyanobium gracile]|uniref:Uncharacterized protein n=1 Tax=Cyanobium gracile (strain ATCC 27147 / PCC 6307) TaxID=292564 RepID=K9P3E5_CYAGP|nr:hypothetical protein [Cyanobium gracile]AFY27498.1 hypothetical protein Cyagr_0302 [Cyanobium gracile PCC 6307]